MAQLFIRLFSIVCAIAAAIFLPMSAHADDKDVIEYRQHIMSTLNEQAAALGEILSTAIPGDNTSAHFEAIALTAKTALKAFEPKVVGGEAKPSVWTEWGDFSKRMNEFAQKTSEAAKIAKQQGKDAALATIVDAFTCKSCHDVYRNEKKR
jgi:cytochrome c556